jgi:serine/threonine-protein kinase
MRSDAIIAALNNSGGWGNGNNLQIDFSIALLTSDASTPRQTITADPGGYCYGGPDCDTVPLQMPLPANGNAEGSTDYNCSNGDCHVLVVATDEHKLYELYNATQAGPDFTALGAFVWDLTKAYPDNERGDQCTSADAAGFPIAGLLPTADEVAAGDVHHAIRFILPNPRMKSGVYVHPASHAGGPSSSDPDAPPYGVRLRLKASFDDSAFNASEKVIIKAMKTHGMLLSDGGNIALTFADDRLSTAKWATLGVTAQSFSAIQVSDFEVVDLSPEITLTYDCVRNP